MKPILALMDCLCSRTSSSLFVFVHLKMNASIGDMRKLGEVSVTSAAMVDMLRAVQVNQGLSAAFGGMCYFPTGAGICLLLLSSVVCAVHCNILAIAFARTCQ